MDGTPQFVEIAYAEQIASSIELLQGRWTIHILCAMRVRSVRLSELRREIPSASKKALTSSLRSLQEARVVVRRDLSSKVLHVEYGLADSMRAPLVKLLDHLAEWGETYTSQSSTEEVVPTGKSESPKL